MSARKAANFVRVNCSAIPAELMESEFFGYAAGAFTGAAKSGKPGMFELAHKGTLLLDEIGELPLPMQAKLLQVLDGHPFHRVGGTKPITVDVRVIAATNRDLQKCVTEGAFREDLYYRLSVFPVWVPPLRERKLDIPKLAASVIEELNQTYEHKKSLTVGAEATLLQYPWPGNVRELENLDRIPAEEGGDLYLINGNMLPLKDAGAFANTESIDDGKEENADEEVLEVEESSPDRDGSGGTDAVSERHHRRGKLV